MLADKQYLTKDALLDILQSGSFLPDDLDLTEMLTKLTNQPEQTNDNDINDDSNGTGSAGSSSSGSAGSVGTDTLSDGYFED